MRTKKVLRKKEQVNGSEGRRLRVGKIETGRAEKRKKHKQVTKHIVRKEVARRTRKEFIGNETRGL